MVSLTIGNSLMNNLNAYKEEYFATKRNSEMMASLKTKDKLFKHNSSDQNNATIEQDSYCKSSQST